MSWPWVLQSLADIVALSSLVFILVRLTRPPQEDPRLSRGLQMLQNKLAVLEDLSDRADTQSRQITALLEQKGKELQEKFLEADRHLSLIEKSLNKSLEVAQIFKDKIPHDEIVERRNTAKYVEAARLAHQGLSVDEIADRVELEKGQIEFITKVNRDNLMFEESELPAWVSDATKSLAPKPQTAADMALRKLGEEFKRSVQRAPSAAVPGNPELPVTAAPTVMPVPATPGKTVTPYVFKKIEA